MLTQIATGLPAEYLRETCGADSFDDVFGDPTGSWFDDNLYVDLAYRCKGVLPPRSLRALIERARSSTGHVSTGLEEISREAATELAVWETIFSQPYQQGHALAGWLRQRFADAAGRVNPDNVLSAWNVAVEKHDFASSSLDAVAFWAHGRQPAILWNDSEKHRENEGALRATLAHEICHLLIDRHSGLPLCAVDRGAMDRWLEKRANAFAAEFLCPRQEAAAEYQQAGNSVDSTISRLTMRFGVSNQLAAVQLARAGAVSDPQSQREIESIGPKWASYPW